jgi:hypothetical protein
MTMELFTGFRAIVRKKKVKPYIYADKYGLTISTHYQGAIACYENGQYLWSQSTGIDRISRGTAQKDAYKLIHDINLKKFYADNPDICPASASPDQSPETLKAIYLNHNQGQDNCPE